MNAVDRAQGLVRREYGLLQLPTIASPEFLSLIRGTRHLLDMTTGFYTRKTARSLSITFDSGSTASTDPQANVRVPAWYCFTESLEEFVGRKMTNKEAAAVSLCLINGSSIHEGLHVAKSMNLFEQRTLDWKKKFVLQNLLDYLLQVLEDLKNESALEATHNAHDLFSYVSVKNEIFFPEAQLTKRVSEMMENGSALKEIALEILVFYKCISRRNKIDQLLREYGLDEVVKILHASCDGEADVLSNVVKLYEIFEKSDNADKQKTQRYEGEKSERASKEIEHSLTEEEKKKFSIEVNEGDGNVQPVQEVDVLANPYRISRRDSITLPLDFRFIKHLKVSRQIVPSHKEPGIRGSVLLNTRLSRIVTDGKIFSMRGDSISSIQKKQPEFILLGDFSGSMRLMIEQVTEALRCISVEMVKSGIPHAVYGHTSVGSLDVPTVYHIFSYKMRGLSSSQHAERFGQSAGIHLVNNYDGYAIQHVAKKFNKASTKVLLVLSDGAPAGSHYEDSMEHTKNSIEIVRKSGVKVISLSLTREVISANDELYGRKYNVDATSQGKLEAELQRIIMG